MFCWISFLFHIGEEDGCSRRGTSRSGIRRGRRGLRRGRRGLRSGDGRGARRGAEKRNKKKNMK